jgi:hypothetical protein
VKGAMRNQVSWPMKPSEIIILFAILAGTGVLMIAGMNAHVNELVTAANKTIGKSEQEAKRELGEPRWRYSSTEYNARERRLISGSYNPDPPPASEGSVLCYTRLASMVMLFVEDGKVVRIHVCGT